MVYQILFVFSLLIIVSNNASYFPKKLTKEEAKRCGENVVPKIGWNLTQPGCTKELQSGIYAAYKLDGKIWNLIGEFAIQKSEMQMMKLSDGKWKNGNVINLSDDKDFNREDTYVIYGDRDANQRMEFASDGTPIQMNNDGNPIDVESIRLDDAGVELMRSEEKCFKEGLDDEEHNETSGWGFNKEMIIFGLIPVAVVLALCSVFACCYVQKKQQKRRIEERVVFPVHSRA